MGVLEIVGGIFMILLSVAIILLVMLQESSKGGGMSALTGDSYYNKNQGRTRDALLFRFTKYAAVLFFVVTIAVYAIQKI